MYLCTKCKRKIFWFDGSDHDYCPECDVDYEEPEEPEMIEITKSSSLGPTTVFPELVMVPEL